jgi:tetratricopeptide (TPR) repeat protein
MLNGEFGGLLTQGVKSIAAREDKPISSVEDELGYETDGTARWNIQKWRQGHVPAEPKKIASLARACVSRGRMDRMWLRRFLTQARYPDKEMLEQELFPREDAQAPKVRCNVPGRSYNQFVGREKEIQDVRRFLSPRHRVGVICLSGIAGVGKSTLAIEVAHRYIDEAISSRSDEHFEAIVWVTAKQTELMSQGLTMRPPTTLRDLESVYRALADVLDHPGITRAASHEDRDILVNSLLSERRTLLILDNLEDIDDPALMVFLRDLPSPSKAIITTRHRIDVAVSLQLKAFNESEAHELALNNCQSRNLSLTDEQTERFLHRTGHLPLAIVRTIARMAWRGSSIESELKQFDHQNDPIYDFCFEKSFSLIRGSNSYCLLLALTFFSVNASRNALGHVAGFQQDILSRDEGLSGLEILSLVNKENGRFSLEPLTKAKVEFELTNHQDFMRDAQQRWIEWYEHFVERAEYPLDRDDLQTEIDNITDILKWLVAQEQVVDVTWFFQRLRKFLFAEGRWEILLPLSKQVAQWAESENNVDVLIDTLETLTRIYREQGNYAQAEEWMERMQLIAESQDHELLQAEIWLNRAGTMYRQRTKPEADLENVHHLLRAVAIFKNHNKKDRAVNALNMLGIVHMKLGRLEEASTYYREALSVLDNSEPTILGERQWYAAIKANLGRVYCLQGHDARAAGEIYEVLPDFTEQTDRAEALSTLIVCQRHLDNRKKVNEHQQELEKIINQLNLVRPIFGEEERKRQS